MYALSFYLNFSTEHKETEKPKRQLKEQEEAAATSDPAAPGKAKVAKLLWRQN